MSYDLPGVQIALIRHATTQWNEKRLIQGWQNSPLSASGRQQALKWAESLSAYSFKRILSSDLGRARDTAQLINSRLGLALYEDKGLRERCFGELEGKPVWSWQGSEDKRERPPGGECRKEVLQRVIKTLLQQQARGGALLVVTHYGVLECLLHYLAGPAHPRKNGRLLKSPRLHWLGINNRALGIIELNQHLEP